MATGNTCGQPHTNYPHHRGSALRSLRDTLNDIGSPSTHTPGTRTCSCPLAEEDAEDGNQQMLEPGPMSVKPQSCPMGCQAFPSGLCRGRTASAHNGCPALGPPPSSQWPDSFTQVTPGRHFHPGSLLPRSPCH